MGLLGAVLSSSVIEPEVDVTPTSAGLLRGIWENVPESTSSALLTFFIHTRGHVYLSIGLVQLSRVTVIHLLGLDQLFLGYSTKFGERSSGVGPHYPRSIVGATARQPGCVGSYLSRGLPLHPPTGALQM